MIKRYSHKKNGGSPSASSASQKRIPSLRKMTTEATRSMLNSESKIEVFRNNHKALGNIVFGEENRQKQEKLEGEFKKKLMKIGKLVLSYDSPEWHEIVDSTDFQTKPTEKYIDFFMKIGEKTLKRDEIYREKHNLIESSKVFGYDSVKEVNSLEEEYESYNKQIKSLEEKLEAEKKIKKNKDTEMKKYLKQKKIDLVFQPFRIDPYLFKNKKTTGVLNNIQRLGAKEYPWWTKDYAHPSMQDQFLPPPRGWKHNTSTVVSLKTTATLNKATKAWISSRPNINKIKKLNVQSKLDKTSAVFYEFFFDTRKHKNLKGLEVFFSPSNKLDMKIMRKISSDNKFSRKEFGKLYENTVKRKSSKRSRSRSKSRSRSRSRSRSGSSSGSSSGENLN